MAIQESISEQKLTERVGQVEQVIIDGYDEQGLVGRSMSDAPEIDGVVFIDSELQYQPGEVLQVRITDSSSHDLWGKIEQQ